jgi:hypothetical protein
MTLLNKLPGSRREPPGLEWYILRRLPLWLLVGTVVPAACYLYAAAFPAPSDADTVEKYLSGVGIAVIATVLTLWTAAFTVAIGCVVVWIMKGPGYVADAYPLVDAEQPGPERTHPTDAAESR